MKEIIPLILLMHWMSINYELKAQARMQAEPKDIKLTDIRWRDMCILPDPVTKTYYMVGSLGRGVGCYTSKDLLNWYGPVRIYDALQDVWGDIPIVSIGAPELHRYKDKYYLFLTFDTRNKLCEQWPNWESNGRVTRGSQVFVSYTPTGPWKQQAEPLYKEDGGHGMVFKTFEGKIMMILHSPIT
jgi:hypothetical protein